jgi:hypothetical protein
VFLSFILLFIFDPSVLLDVLELVETLDFLLVATSVFLIGIEVFIYDFCSAPLSSSNFLALS